GRHDENGAGRICLGAKEIGGQLVPRRRSYQACDRSARSRDLRSHLGGDSPRVHSSSMTPFRRKTPPRRRDHFAVPSRALPATALRVRRVIVKEGPMTRSIASRTHAFMLSGAALLAFACSAGNNNDGSESLAEQSSAAHTFCGNSKCDHGETCSTCPQDCGS